MTTANPHSFADQIAAAQAWWRDAGVDCDFTDEPGKWLPKAPPADSGAPANSKSAPAIPPPPTSPSTIPAIKQVDRSRLPDTLDDFAQWWLHEPTLDEGGLFPRIAPRGKAGASLMIVVQQPEETDTNTLLSGQQGTFLNAILSAMGLPEQEIYLASALPRYIPLTDWDGLALNGTGEVLRHHVELAAPTRLLLFGQRIPPLLGHDPAQNPASLLQVELGSRTVAALATRDLASLLNRPRWRAEFWRRWLDWTEDANT